MDAFNKISAATTDQADPKFVHSFQVREQTPTQKLVVDHRYRDQSRGVFCDSIVTLLFRQRDNGTDVSCNMDFSSSSHTNPRNERIAAREFQRWLGKILQ